MRESSNVGTIKIAEMLGKERFDAYLRAFGFGTKTRTRLPGRVDRLLLPVEEYDATEPWASIPIG